jgi:hypothetical protein
MHKKRTLKKGEKWLDDSWLQLSWQIEATCNWLLATTLELASATVNFDTLFSVRRTTLCAAGVQHTLGKENKN